MRTETPEMWFSARDGQAGFSPVVQEEQLALHLWSLRMRDTSGRRERRDRRETEPSGGHLNASVHPESYNESQP